MPETAGAIAARRLRRPPLRLRLKLFERNLLHIIHTGYAPHRETHILNRPARVRVYDGGGTTA